MCFGKLTPRSSTRKTKSNMNKKKAEGNPSSTKDITKNFTEEQIAEFRESFNLFDQNRDGMISDKEMLSVMNSLGHTSSHADVLRMIQEVDTNGDGEIDFQEFLLMMSKQRSVSNEDKIREAFNVFDKDRNGFITVDEMRTVMQSLGENLTDDEVKAMIDEADSDGDGQVNFEEFKNVMATKS